MILRRVIAHFKKQEWTAVALDFVIVVVGVFIGIQVSNWNDARANAERERETLAAILDDLRTDREVLASGLAMAKVNINASNYALEKAGLDSLKEIELPVVNTLSMLGGEGIEIPPPYPVLGSQTSQLWKLMTVHYYPTQSDAAFGALVAAGNLNIITDADLVRDLQRYAVLWRGLANSIDTTHRSLRDEALFTGQEFGLSPFSTTQEDDFTAMLQNHPKLVGAVRTMLEFTVLRTRQIESVDRKAVDLMARIESELN